LSATVLATCGNLFLSDKPICISPDELARIKHAASQANRIVGCMLDMRDLPVYLGLRDAIQNGAIGTVHAISFDGQHPLLYGKRPDWYYETEMHGGVLNDIAVHAVDFIPWATGMKIERIVAAREWNATLPDYPDFRQCGQAMFTLENGAGVICDVSYLTPDSFAYDFPFYWRFTIWGADGVLEAGVNSKTIHHFRNGDRKVAELTLPNARPGGYLESFLLEIGGQTEGLHLSADDVYRASKTALDLQQAAQ
jgi:predicted dehydrogenase